MRTHRSVLAVGLFALLQAANVSHALTFGRIATFTRDTAGATTFEIIDFCFDDDAVGNLTSKLGQGAYTYDTASKRLASLGVNTYSYDANGNVMSDGQRTIQYNPFNLPDWINKGGAQLNYSYDGAHARVNETSPTHGTTYSSVGLGGGYEFVIPADSTAANPKREERTYVSTPKGTLGVIPQTSVGTPAVNVATVANA